MKNHSDQMPFDTKVVEGFATGMEKVIITPAELLMRYCGQCATKIGDLIPKSWVRRRSISQERKKAPPLP